MLPTRLALPTTLNSPRCGRFQLPNLYGKIGSMKKTLDVDAKLYAEAKAACGARTSTETLRLGLEALIRRAANERMLALRRSLPRAADVPPRRKKPSPKRSVQN